jgi:hypothetical protein
MAPSDEKMLTQAKEILPIVALTNKEPIKLPPDNTVNATAPIKNFFS